MSLSLALPFYGKVWFCKIIVLVYLVKSFLTSVFVSTVFWFLLKSKVRAIILSVLWRWFWLSISASCTKPANKACTGLVGTVRLFEHFQRPEHFSARRVNQRPAHKPVTQTVETVEKACPEQVAETLSKGGENLTTNVA